MLIFILSVYGEHSSPLLYLLVTTKNAQKKPFAKQRILLYNKVIGLKNSLRYSGRIQNHR